MHCKNDSGIIVLAFMLTTGTGWLEDSFSTAGYTNRQRDYAHILILMVVIRLS